MKYTLSLCMLAAAPLYAENTRAIGAHEHGVGELNIAIEANTIAFELRAPGADIVGFEYQAKTAEDRRAVDSAVATLARPLDLFAFPADASCGVTKASAALEHEDMHAAHREHEAHRDEQADAHDHNDHNGHNDHGDHEHEEKAEMAGHTEFHAAYQINCANPGAVTEIVFTYFDVFENARELEVQIVTQAGAQAFEVDRSEPRLDLRGMF